jgi:hypothetical protein
MEDADIKQQLHLLQKQIEATVSVHEETKLNLLSQVDSLKIELEVLKRFIAHHHSDFERHYVQLKDTVTQEIDPEWLEQGGKRAMTKTKER